MYNLKQSPFYKLKSKKKCAELLGVNLANLKSAVNNKNYQVYTVESKSCSEGIKKSRIIQNPQGVTRKLQASILKYIKRIDVPIFLHSAVKERSYKTNAQCHVDAFFLYKVDIKSFYNSVSMKKIKWLFLNKFECSPDVSYMLASLCTYKGFLPTGAPTSPILSYFANCSMFFELQEYAKQKLLKMTVYVDDVTFSGIRITKEDRYRIDYIIKKYGYTPHKQCLFKPSQTKIVTGVAICANRLDIPNYRRGRIRRAGSQYLHESNRQKKDKLLRSLKGMLNEASQFNKNFVSHIEHKFSLL